MKNTLTKKEIEAYSIIGKIGGRASYRKRGKKGMSEMGKKGAKKRWENYKKKTVDKSLAK